MKDVRPGDLVFVRYLDLDEKPQTFYFVIAVYETKNGLEMFYYRPQVTRSSATSQWPSLMNRV